MPGRIPRDDSHASEPPRGTPLRPFPGRRRLGDLPTRAAATTGGIVAGHGLLAIAWLGISVLLVEPLARLLDQSPVTISAVSALGFVAASTLVLTLGLHRWRVRAEWRARQRSSPADLDRMRSMFLAAVSHELRTPVTNLVGYAETLRTYRNELNPDQVDRITGRLIANGERLERLVLDLLDLHPGSSRDHPVARSAVDVDALLPALVEQHLGERHVATVRSTAGTALLESRGLERIVAELLDNVARHTPPGTRVEVSSARHGGAVLIVVEDDGPGIDASVTGTVEDPFVQGLGTAQDPTPGLGIGLSLVAHHAERHGGRVSLTPATSGGTRATVLLPSSLIIPEMSEASEQAS